MRFVLAQDLKPGMLLAKTVYLNHRAAMLKKGTELTENFIAYFVSHGYFGMYVNDLFAKDVEMQEVIDEGLFEQGVEAVEGQDIGDLLNIAADVVDGILENKDVKLGMVDIRNFDDYTYHHSVNVAVYSVAVGQRMGLRPEELNEICVAGLCHDLGKSEIPIEILHKPGKLTDEEFAIIKTHPQKAYDMLYDNQAIPINVRMAVLAHHENEDGSGYPNGKKQREIPLAAKIIHAVDVYDALTSKRPYKDPYSPADALEYIKNRVGTMFSKGVVRAMLEAIPVYPPGIEVLLSNGETALVVSHTTDPERPIIKLFSNSKLINLMLDDDYKEITIEKSAFSIQEYQGSVDGIKEAELANRKKILLVDVDEDSLKATKDLLDKDYNVYGFTNGLMAVLQLDKTPPDLIITEINVKTISGFNILNSARRRGLTVPCIFLTKENDLECVMEGKRMGCSDYILKPAKPEYLTERVKTLLN